MNTRPNEHRKRLQSRLLTGIVLLMVLLTASCSGKLPSILNFLNDKKPQSLQAQAHTLATKGMNDFNVGKYFSALKSFQQILDRYPFSQEATLAELKAADCNYYEGHYQQALTLYEKFEERHPTNEAVPYVMFQKGMSEYKQIDRIDRDTSGAVAAIKYFNQLLRAYPDSPYTQETNTRIKDARGFLANHEYFVADFYIRTKKYKEAKTRLKYLLAMYPDSAIAPKAQKLLKRLEDGNPPKSTFFSWLPKMKLPRL